MTSATITSQSLSLSTTGRQRSLPRSRPRGVALRTSSTWNAMSVTVREPPGIQVSRPQAPHPPATARGYPAIGAEASTRRRRRYLTQRARHSPEDPSRDPLRVWVEAHRVLKRNVAFSAFSTNQCTRSCPLYPALTREGCKALFFYHLLDTKDPEAGEVLNKGVMGRGQCSHDGMDGNCRIGVCCCPHHT